ncbi:MAG: hypothetical protein VW647_07590, partial [Alphaproteobacteria bacterium]
MVGHSDALSHAHRSHAAPSAEPHHCSPKSLQYGCFLLAEITAMMGRLAAGNMLAALLLSAFLITPHVAVAELSTSEEKGISLIIDDQTTLRFASGSFNAETIEGSIKDFTLIIDGEETFRGDRLTLERTHGSDPDIFLIKSLEIDNLR